MIDLAKSWDAIATARRRDKFALRQRRHGTAKGYRCCLLKRRLLTPHKTTVPSEVCRAKNRAAGWLTVDNLDSRALDIRVRAGGSPTRDMRARAAGTQTQDIRVRAEDTLTPDIRVGAGDTLKLDNGVVGMGMADNRVAGIHTEDKRKEGI
jgi:hypothetical protein